MKIGIPRALLYYKYKDLWRSFFKELNIDIVYSPTTNKDILKKGIKHSIDEACLPSKIFMGHVYFLINKCDYILIPRIASVKKKEELCTKFSALVDIVENTFKEAKIIEYDVDVKNNKNEKKAFLKMGKNLGFKSSEVKKAYKRAVMEQMLENRVNIKKQQVKLRSKKQKVLIVSHVYNLHDEYLGKPIMNILKSMDVVPIFAHCVPQKEAMKESKKLSECLYWTYNKELLGGIEIYKNKVDGIILISSFPCGPDSLVNELVIRKIKDKPVINIILDEQTSDTGLNTRIESFVDIIRLRNDKSE